MARAPSASRIRRRGRCDVQRNNVLLIVADQWRSDALGVSGGWVDTPNLDGLASHGVLFDNCLTNAPICIPARVSLATGLYPHNTGIWGNVEYDLPPDSDTWMQRVRAAGYRTCLIGKSHLHRHVGDLRDREHLMHAYGFDDVDEIAGPRRSMVVRSNMTQRWSERGVWEAYIEDYRERFSNKPFVARPSAVPTELYADVYVGQRAREYLRDYDGDRPWCCTVSFGGPHEPWDAPEPYASMYRPERMPAPIARSPGGGARSAAAIPESVPGGPPARSRPRGFLDHLYEPGNPHSPELTANEIAAMRANYAGNVRLIDDQIGEILEVVANRGELDRTDVLFVSDHGEMNGDHGLIYKENFFDASVRVPLIVSTADMRRAGTPGRRYDGMVEWFDVGPTVCDLAGAEEPPATYRQFARSLVPVLGDPGLAHRSEALCELHGEVMVRTREWKLALNREGEAYLLFDLEADPEETTNLVAEPGVDGVVRRLKDRVLRRLLESQTYLAAPRMRDMPSFTRS